MNERDSDVPVMQYSGLARKSVSVQFISISKAVLICASMVVIFAIGFVQVLLHDESHDPTMAGVTNVYALFISVIALTGLLLAILWTEFLMWRLSGAPRLAFLLWLRRFMLILLVVGLMQLGIVIAKFY